MTGAGVVAVLDQIRRSTDLGTPEERSRGALKFFFLACYGFILHFTNLSQRGAKRVIKNDGPDNEKPKANEESSHGPAHQPSNTDTNTEQAAKKKREWFAWIKETPAHSRIEVFFTFIIAVATSIYTYVSCNQLAVINGQLRQMQQQTTLQRQQLVGIQGAVIEISPVWDPTTQVLSTILVNSNQNGVSGVISNFRAKVQRKTWPKEEPIGEPFIIELPTPEITILKGGQFPIDKGLPSPLPPQITDLRLWPGSEVVTLDGNFTYDDGFGDLHSYRFCYLWVAPWTIPSPGGWSGGGWSGGKQGCPTVQEKINEVSGYRKKFDEITGGTHPLALSRQLRPRAPLARS